MKKLSDINEGFMTRSLNRNKSGEERIESKITSNIGELNEVDLGVVKISDEDVEINGEEIFTYYDMIKYKPYIEKLGWKILDFDTMMDIICSFDIACVPYDDNSYSIKNKKTGQEIFISRHVEWWVDNTDVKRRKKIAEHPNSTYGNTLTTITHIDYNVKTKNALLPIRLIRK